ncbi:hypothetical protein C8Q75DRAFT_806301 [Abortiporus biennis]|nr:hypothetical protein C8Q75DRAFT_806301 [Abortiporus biennis]
MSDKALENTRIQLNVNLYLSCISFTILYYDYILTLPTEINLYWQPILSTIGLRSNLLTSGRRDLKFSLLTALFFITRYLAIFGHIPVGIEVFWPKHDPILVGFLLIIRTYALYNRSKRILWLILSTAFVVIVVGCWSIIQTGPKALPIPIDIGCDPRISASAGHALAIAWSGMLGFDILIFFLTIYKAISARSNGRRTLLDILLRDGSIYFGCIAISNLSNIITFILGQSLIKGLTTILTNVISATLISRLMLNLRDPEILYPELKRTSENRFAFSGGTFNSSDYTVTLTNESHFPIVSTVYPAYCEDRIPSPLV